MAVHIIRGFELCLIDEPLQSHVVAWERASRALKSADAKPILARVMDTLNEIRVTENNFGSVLQAFNVISIALRDAIGVLENNESLTLSANRGMMVKAAIQARWILSPELKLEDVDAMQPWKVQWMAEKIAALYLEATTIPKN